MKDETSTEVATAPSALPALPIRTTIREIFDANFGIRDLPPSFEMIHVPAGGGQSWTIPNDTEEGSKRKNWSA